MNSSMFLIAAFLIFQAFIPSSAAADYDLCHRLRSYNVTYGRCVSSLQSDPRSPTANYHELAVISVNLTIASATAVQSKFEAAAKKYADPTTKGLLANCRSLYARNITSLRSAADEVELRNYAGAADVLFTFASMPGACDDQFRAKKGVASLLRKENLGLTNIALVAHAINDFMSNYYQLLH